MIRLAPVLLACFLLLTRTASAVAQGMAGQPAPDFPPGTFSDGGQYRLSDLKGKVVVLFFFESKCPRCRASIPERTAVVKAMQGKPVLFLAVGANINQAEALKYQRETGLAMPIFADGLGTMQARYGFKISLQNIWQMRVIGPDGIVRDYNMTVEAINKVLDKVMIERKFNVADYNPKLSPVVECFEFDQYVLGLRALAPLRQSANKPLAESALKLFEVAKTEGEKWKTEAAAAAASEPLKAYDLYSKIANAFLTDELGKAASASAKKLATDEKIATELAGRKAFAQLNLGQTTALNRQSVLQSCQIIAKKYPGTPTADRATEFAKELGELIKK